MEELVKWFNENYPEYKLALEDDFSYVTCTPVVRYKIVNPKISKNYAFGGMIVCGKDYTDRTTKAVTEALKESISKAINSIG